MLVTLCKYKNVVIHGQPSKAKMASPRGKLRVLISHLTKKANKIDKLTYISTNIGLGRKGKHILIKTICNKLGHVAP
jgi:hypothetical protein